VLLDVVMPGLDGYQVLAQLRADEELRRVPVVVLSAADELADAVRCLALGAEDYLPKPFDAVLLRARLGACLERKRLRDREAAHLATIEAQAAALADWNRTLERRVREQLEELERVNRLRRFLSPQLADVIVSSGDERLLESHRREVTVLFCDLRGFTPFAETAEPEEVMGVLRDYHAALGRLIFEYEGTLERFAGDGLMVFFNDPLPCPDPAARAVRLALAIRERSAALAAGWRRRGHDLDVGVGVAMGYATLGRIGFEGRSDYAAIGTVTNLAARLCGEARPGQILVSQRVYAEVEDVVEAERLPDLTLKGFHRPVPAFEVLGLGESPPAAPGAGAGGARPDAVRGDPRGPA
jgi:adenylate cyclase